MGSTGAATGPDFSAGVRLEEIPEGGMLGGRVGEEKVLLSRVEGKLFAVGGACTHYGASLADGLSVDGTIRCPLHHACFSLRTGAALSAPAFDPLDRWDVEVETGLAFVRRRAREAAPIAAAKPAADIASIVIVGGGAAGFACADSLRRKGYQGRLTMVSADCDPPCDRPNLSKDFLAGTAPAEWIPLRPADYYRELSIDLHLQCEIVRIDVAERRVHSASGKRWSFDRLLLAPGSEPRQLGAPGFGRENVFALRSLRDACTLVDRSGRGRRAVIIGSSFIGLEAGAALRQRGVEVDVVSMETAPFDQQFGPQVGQFFRRLHAEKGVRFHLGTTASSFDGRNVRLVNGETIEADFVLLGIGVRPRLSLAHAAGLADDDGIRVDRFMATDGPGIYAAGDAAAFPDSFTGDRIRIEHWATAQRQGQVAAANMLGIPTPFEAVPFFWTEQYGVALRFVGRANSWDEVRMDGDPGEGEFTARYFRKGEFIASASIGRDLENLEDERRLERRLTDRFTSGSTAPGTSAAERHPMTARASGGANGL